MSIRKCARNIAIAALAVVVTTGATHEMAVAAPSTISSSAVLKQAPQSAFTDPSPFTDEQVSELRLSAAVIVRDARASGAINSQEEARLRDYLVDGRTSNRVLPAWAVGALAGCAISVFNGPVKTQTKELLKTGKVDAASNIAVDAAVDCVFGGIPGGAITSAVKKTLTAPIKNALKPHVKTVLLKLRGGAPPPKTA